MASELKNLTASAWTQLTTGVENKTAESVEGTVLITVTDAQTPPASLNAPFHKVLENQSRVITAPTIAWARASSNSAKLVLS